MSSDGLIAVMSDALRGLLQGAMPDGAQVGLASPEAAPATGLSVHLFRIAQPPMTRSAPVLGSDGKRLRQAVNVNLDYLVAGSAGDALQAHGLLGAAMRAFGQVFVYDDHSIKPLLAEPARLGALKAKTLLVQLKPLDLPLEEQCSVWQASGSQQRAGLFLRVEAAWEAADALGTPAPVRIPPELE